jgi:hypothetical protein
MSQYIYKELLAGWLYKKLINIQQQREEFIFGISDDNETSDINNDNWFIVIKNKEDNQYYYVLLEEDYEHLDIAMEKFTDFMYNRICEGKEDFTKFLHFSDAYDINSLTSAPTLNELFARFCLVYDSTRFSGGTVVDIEEEPVWVD